MIEQDIQYKIGDIVSKWGYHSVMFRLSKLKNSFWLDLYIHKNSKPSNASDNMTGYSKKGFDFLCVERGTTRKAAYLKIMKRVDMLDERKRYLESVKKNGK